MFARGVRLVGCASSRSIRKAAIVLLVVTVLSAGLLAPLPALATDVDSYEPDDTYATATAIVVDVVQQHTIAPAEDVDWISFSVSAGETYWIQTASGTPAEDIDTVLELYDSDGTTYLDSDDDGGSGAYSLIQYTADANKTLYVSVSEFYGTNTGAYSIAVAAASDIYEPDDSFGAATSIAIDAVAQQHMIIPADDQDWVSFSVSADRTYRITTTSGTPANDFDVVVTLYDSNGTTELESSDQNWSTPDELIEYTATANKTVSCALKAISAKREPTH